MGIYIYLTWWFITHPLIYHRGYVINKALQYFFNRNGRLQIFAIYLLHYNLKVLVHNQECDWKIIHKLHAKYHSYPPRTLLACCSQSKLTMFKIRKISARALFLYNTTKNCPIFRANIWPVQISIFAWQIKAQNLGKIKSRQALGIA